MPTLRGFSLLSTPFSGVRWPIVAHLAEFQPSLGPHGHHNRPLFGRNWRDTDSCLVKKSLLVWSGALLLLCTSFRRQVQGTTLFSFLFFWLGDNVPSWGLACPGQAQHWPPIYKTRLFAARLPHTTANHRLASPSPSRLPGRPSFPPSPCQSLPGYQQPDTPLVGKRNRKGKVCVFHERV